MVLLWPDIGPVVSVGLFEEAEGGLDVEMTQW